MFDIKDINHRNGKVTEFSAVAITLFPTKKENIQINKQFNKPKSEKSSTKRNKTLTQRFHQNKLQKTHKLSKTIL